MTQDFYKKNLFKPTECLSQDVLLRYVQDGLTPEEHRLAELHLCDCDLCSDAVEGLLMAPDYDLAAEVAVVNTLIQTRVQGAEAETEGNAPVIEFRPERKEMEVGNGSKRRNWVSIISVAAAVAILFTFAFLFFGNDATPNSIADKYFAIETPDVFRGAPSGPDGGSNPESNFAEGKSAMLDGNFAEAAKKFERVDSGDAAFLAGDCYFKLREFEKAAASYQKAIQKRESDYGAFAEFNLGLTYLQLNKVGEAKQLFQTIAADTTHPDAVEAGKVLEELGKLKGQ